MSSSCMSFLGAQNRPTGETDQREPPADTKGSLLWRQGMNGRIQERGHWNERGNIRDFRVKCKSGLEAIVTIHPALALCFQLGKRIISSSIVSCLL